MKTRWIIILWIGLAIASFAQDARPPARLVVMSAFDAELSRLLAQAKVSERRVIHGRTYHVGTLADREVVLVLSGVSIVNAAMTAQAAIDNFQVRGIVFSGIAGGVNPDLHIGDVTVPAQWGEYQNQLFARQTPEGWKPRGPRGEWGNFGMMFPEKVEVTRAGAAADIKENRLWFPVSPEMLEVAKKVSGSVQLARETGTGVRLKHDPRIVVGGNGVSGPTFVDNADYRKWVWEKFRADALDMESAAVAHVAYCNGVPFIAFRSLSDLAGGEEGNNEIAIFFKLASDNSAAVVMAFLKEWKPR